MRLIKWSGLFVILVAVGLIFSASGCSKDEGKSPTDKGSKVAKGGEKTDEKTKKGDNHKGEKSTHDHSGWWCEEHGVPESKCSLCLSEEEVKKKFKDVGDWCKIHERALSQCFKCDPSKYANFEKEYVAKYGTKPPRPPESEFTK